MTTAKKKTAKSKPVTEMRTKLREMAALLDTLIDDAGFVGTRVRPLEASTNYRVRISLERTVVPLTNDLHDARAQVEYMLGRLEGVENE